MTCEIGTPIFRPESSLAILGIACISCSISSFQ